MADDLGVDIETVQGTGVGGRLRKQDLVAKAPPPKPVTDPRRGTSQRLSPTMVARADLAVQTKLALTAGIEADLSLCHPADGNYIGHILRAVAGALRQTADINASLIGDDVAYHDAENIGWSVDTPIGPIAPVLHDASSRTAEELGDEVTTLTAKARSAELEPEDLKEGTFTVRNDGATGLTWATPTINRPQVAALSIGSVTQQAIIDEGQVRARPVVALTLCYDRRVVDPRTAAEFLKRVQAGLRD